MSKLSVLVVDDEHDILELIEYNLNNEGYQVFTVDNGIAALDFVKQKHPDLILLDIMMPGMNGLEVCKNLKSNPELKSIPVIFLTAKSDESSEITGLDIGADDYITKPISISRLLSRIKTVMRRFKNASAIPGNQITIADLQIDREQYLVLKSEKEIRFPRKEFEVLYYLASNPGKVISRQSLLNEIWGNNIYVVDRTIDVHIRKIREKLQDDYIETVKGVGYRFKKHR